MKRIEAMIQPHRLTLVVQALHALPRFPGFTVLDAQGQGQGQGAGGHYVYGTDGLLFRRCQLLVIVCEDAEAHAIAQVLSAAAHTGTRGDGLVTISEIAELVRIRDAAPVAGGVA